MLDWAQERVAIVTGGASGIGRGIVLKLLDAGASVLVADIAAEPASAPRSMHMQVDVARPEDVQRMVTLALNTFGRLDFLVNCAGNAHVGPVVDMPFEAWRSVLDIHLTGTFLCCRATIDPLVASRGRIVSISSTYAYKGRPNGAHYSAAKAGIVALTKVLAGELAPHVNVNAIAPGPIDTPRWRGGLSDAEYAAKKARRIQDIPLGRIGQPEDIASAAVFLLGPASQWITGSVLHVNGGEFMA
jgi:NAD(P)-dependent dehydrogenase (short-subunit alcohol dehydrogenase family)